MPVAVDCSVFGNNRTDTSWSDLGFVGRKPTGRNQSNGNGSTGRTLSDRALNLVNNQRAEEYGEPLEHCRKVAAVWAAAFGWDVDARKFALAMNFLKLVREAHSPKEDSRVDAVGWGEIEDQIVKAGES